MKILVQKGNILDFMGKHYIAHAISGDFSLGAGVAKKINEKFKEVYPNSPHDNLSEALKHEFITPKNINTPREGNVYLVENIINIAVKETWRDKIDSFVLYIALEELAALCMANDIKTLYMPKICSGKEKLEWDKVQCLIEDAFTDCDTEIIIVSYDEEETQEEISIPRKCELYNEMLNYLSELIDDEEDLYDTLIGIGFTPEEIEYEGFGLADEEDEDEDEEEIECCDGDCENCSWECDGDGDCDCDCHDDGDDE